MGTVLLLSPDSRLTSSRYRAKTKGSSIDSVIESGVLQNVRLMEPLDVLLMYWTDSPGETVRIGLLPYTGIDLQSPCQQINRSLHIFDCCRSG